MDKKMNVKYELHCEPFKKYIKAHGTLKTIVLSQYPDAKFQTLPSATLIIVGGERIGKIIPVFVNTGKNGCEKWRNRPQD